MPDKEHRETYVRNRSKSLEIVLTDEQIEKVLDDTSKYTMAMMQELFTGAVLCSFSEDKPLVYEHLRKSLKNIDNSLKVARKEEGKKKAGFGPAADE